MSGIARSRLAEERKGELSILAGRSLYLPAPPGRVHHEGITLRPEINHILFYFFSHSPPSFSFCLHSHATNSPSPPSVWRKDRPHGFFARPETSEDAEVTPAYSPEPPPQFRLPIISVCSNIRRARARRRGKGVVKQTKGSFTCVPTRWLWLEVVVFLYFFPLITGEQQS